MNERKIQRITNRIKGILQHEIKEEKIAGGQAACFLRGKNLFTYVAERQMLNLDQIQDQIRSTGFIP